MERRRENASRVGTLSSSSPKGGPLWLFYKAGPTPANWWGMLISSKDDGKTWSNPRRLPDGFLGPVKNKPITLKDGSILAPTSFENQGWRIHFERTSDLGRTWQTVGPVDDDKTWEAIQPTLLTHPDGRIQALSRSQQSKIVECWSADGGKSWSKLVATSLPNPDSGIDAVTLADGRHLLVYNPTTKGRSPLNVAVSPDGKTWKTALVLEDQPGEYSYPAVIQSADGLVHITYTWHRKKIRHAVLDPQKLVPRSDALREPLREPHQTSRQAAGSTSNNPSPPPESRRKAMSLLHRPRASHPAAGQYLRRLMSTATAQALHETVGGNPLNRDCSASSPRL